jgi:hypothetical protein
MRLQYEHPIPAIDAIIFDLDRDGRPSRITPHPDGPFAQPPDVPAIPEFDEKGIKP